MKRRRKRRIYYDGQMIRAARMRRGWDPADLASRADISVAQLGRIEKGTSGLPSTVARVCKKVGLRIADLVIEEQSA